jgi:pteridine reductase
MASERPVVLITGAARRLGAAIARALHADGYDLALHYRSSAADMQRLERDLLAARPGSVVTLQADLAEFDRLPELVARTVGAFGRLDALVNNASAFFPTPLGEATPAQWDALFAANARAPFFLSQAAAPHLRAARGAIVNLADVYASRPLREHALYGMSKAALVHMTRALALELAPEVRVNAIAPGAILWPEGDGRRQAGIRQAGDPRAHPARPHRHPGGSRRRGALAAARGDLRHRPGHPPGRRTAAAGLIPDAPASRPRPVRPERRPKAGVEGPDSPHPRIPSLRLRPLRATPRAAPATLPSTPRAAPATLPSTPRATPATLDEWRANGSNGGRTLEGDVHRRGRGVVLGVRRPEFGEAAAVAGHAQPGVQVQQRLEHERVLQFRARQLQRAGAVEHQVVVEHDVDVQRPVAQARAVAVAAMHVLERMQPGVELERVHAGPDHGRGIQERRPLEADRTVRYTGENRTSAKRSRSSAAAERRLRSGSMLLPRLSQARCGARPGAPFTAPTPGRVRGR